MMEALLPNRLKSLFPVLFQHIILSPSPSTHTQTPDIVWNFSIGTNSETEREKCPGHGGNLHFSDKVREKEQLEPSGSKEQTVHVINTEGHVCSVLNVTVLISMMQEPLLNQLKHCAKGGSIERFRFQEANAVSTAVFPVHYVWIYRLGGTTGWGREQLCLWLCNAGAVGDL